MITEYEGIEIEVSQRRGGYYYAFYLEGWHRNPTPKPTQQNAFNAATMNVRWLLRGNPIPRPKSVSCKGDLPLPAYDLRARSDAWTKDNLARFCGPTPIQKRRMVQGKQRALGRIVALITAKPAPKP